MRRPAIPLVFGLAALFLASTALAVVSQQELTRATRLQRKGDRALRDGKTDVAERFFRQAIEEVPGFPSSHIALGQLAMEDKDFERALGHFEQARDGYQDLGDALFDIRTKRYADAQQEIATIQDQIRHLETTVGGGGYLRIQITKMQSQISRLQAIEPPDPDESREPPGEIHFYIGNALYQLGRRQDAEAAWRTCRDKSPDFAMVYNNLALIYMETGRLDEAKECLDRAEELGFQVSPQFREDLDRAMANPAA